MPFVPKVFISYAHEAGDHPDHVLAFADTLTQMGITVILDRYNPAPPEGWPRWMDQNLDAADYVLMVCSPAYKRRVEGLEAPGKGLGVQWEGTAIYNRIYNTPNQGSRYIPILFPGFTVNDVPLHVQQHTRYQIAQFDLADNGFEGLYRHITHQPAVVAPQPGNVVTLPPKPRPTGLTPGTTNATQPPLVNPPVTAPAPNYDEDKLITFLERLTTADLDRIIIRLPGASAQVPDGVTQFQRVIALVKYARAEQGPGIPKLVDVIIGVFKIDGSRFF